MKLNDVLTKKYIYFCFFLQITFIFYRIFFFFYMICSIILSYINKFVNIFTFFHFYAPKVAVAIVPDIFISKNSSIEKSIQEFSQNTLRKWGIGNQKCHDGILLVYIKRLGSFIVSKREGVEDKYINEAEIKHIFMNSYFATGSISKALISSLNFINKKLPSKPQGRQCEK